MIGGFVIDTNVVLQWLLREPATAVGNAANDRLPDSVLHAPAQLWAEVHTGILKRERAGALTEDDRADAFSTLEAFGIEYDHATEADRPRLLNLALARGLTIYDAFFLDVAIRRDLPLATNDEALRRAAAAEGVRLV